MAKYAPPPSLWLDNDIDNFLGKNIIRSDLDLFCLASQILIRFLLECQLRIQNPISKSLR